MPHKNLQTIKRSPCRMTEFVSLRFWLLFLCVCLLLGRCFGFQIVISPVAKAPAAAAAAVPITNTKFRRRTPMDMILSMSYLDTLSQPEDNDEDDDDDDDDDDVDSRKNNTPQQQSPSSSSSSASSTTTLSQQGQGPKWKSISGGIPTGRGPQASYLQAMSNPTPNQNNEQEDPQETTNASLDNDDGNDDIFSKTNDKPASWSAEYLSDFLHGDDPRTDIRNLLTQRSIQSFMCLLEHCRDPHSAKWIQQDFLNTGNLIDYHGTGAAFIESFGGTWDASLLQMIQQPKDRIIISAKRRGRGHGGWSKHNPYLKERWVEMPVDIDPCK